MRDRLNNALFSLNGASLAVGALGFLSGVVQLFVDTSVQVSIKWLLLLAWLSLTVILIFAKVVYDLSNEKKPSAPYEVPIKFLHDQQIFVIRRNDNFLNNILVGCYLQRDEVDTLVSVGVVHIVQEKVIQIKLQGALLGYNEPPTSAEALSRIVIRPVVPVDALRQFTSAGATNE